MNSDSNTLVLTFIFLLGEINVGPVILYGFHFFKL